MSAYRPNSAMPRWIQWSSANNWLRSAAAVAIGFGVTVSAVPADAAAVLPMARAAAAGARASLANPAEIFVQENIDKGYMILNEEGPEAQRHLDFREFMLGLIDERRIGMFTLGPYANRASKEDIDAFIAAFADYTVAVYETRLGQYKNQVLKVVGSVPRAADDVVVNCEATDPQRPNDPPYKVAFRIRKGTDGRFIVTDMNIEGIWQTLSQRADFTGFLQQHGGRLSDLVTDLKRQTQVLYANA